MPAPPSIPPRVVLINTALVLAWLPVIYGARVLVGRVIAQSPSDDLLTATYLSVVGTLIIVTVSYLFGLVLLNKYLTQNLAEGSQRRVSRTMLLTALALYGATGGILFATL